MKLLITVVSPHIDAALDPRFGRAANFLFVDPDTLEWQAEPNPALNASGGAGIKAAQYAADHQCQAVLSGDFGPNAFDVLHAAGVSMYLFGDCTTAQQAVQAFNEGALVPLESPTASGHHGK